MYQKEVLEKQSQVGRKTQFFHKIEKKKSKCLISKESTRYPAIDEIYVSKIVFRDSHSVFPGQEEVGKIICVIWTNTVQFIILFCDVYSLDPVHMLNILHLPFFFPKVFFFFQSSLCCCLVAKLCPTLCDLLDCSMPGSPVPQRLPEFAQIHVHEVYMGEWDKL